MEAKGRINTYTCRTCGKVHVTIDAAEGVTSMLIGCRGYGCKGMATSACYQVDQELVPAYAWYKPGKGEMKRLDQETRAHVQRGGLLLRRA